MTNGVITGYEVHYQEESGGRAGTLSGIVFTSVELTGLKPNTTYNILVLAINGAGNGEVTDIQGTTLANRKLSNVWLLTARSCYANTWMA